MDTLTSLWNSWTYIFREIPSGDPYIAAFVLVILMVVAAKMARRASKFFYI